MIYLRRITGNSMMPTYKSRQLIVFIKRSKYKQGDVVLVRHDGIEKVKRVKKVNNQKIYLQGDNLIKSTDSRHFGGINLSLIAGKAWPNKSSRKYSDSK